MQRWSMNSRSTLRQTPLFVKYVIGANPRYRSFHPSRPNLLIDEALQASHQVFHLVHDSTGLGWGLSIPLTACLFQISFTPIQYLVDRNLRIRQNCANLLTAWTKIYQKQALYQYGPDEPGNKEKAITAVQASLTNTNKNLLKQHGAKGNWFSGLSLLFLPIWFTNFSVLRRMCGTMEENFDVQNTLPTPSDAAGISLEPSFATEGLAWATDLTMADPTWIFPIFAWGLIANMVIRNAIKPADQFIAGYSGSLEARRPGSSSKLLGEIFKQVMFTYAAFIGVFLISNEIPTAVILFLIGSTTTATIRKLILSRLVGLNKPIKAAEPRRPIDKSDLKKK